MAKLNQVVAIEKGVKSRIYGEVTEMHKLAQKADLFNGFVKNYRRKDEDAEDYPPEKKKVQMQADATLASLSKLLTELVNVTAQKDWANCTAAASIEIDGKVLVADVPATHLLFLEKQLTDIRTFVDKMPTLDEADDWAKDDGTGLFKTAPIATYKTKKVQKPIVLYDATEKHPAQTQLITEDIVVGYWDTVKHSGALPAPRKQEILGRIETLLGAVKFAREKANEAEAPKQSVGDALFSYLFA